MKLLFLSNGQDVQCLFLTTVYSCEEKKAMVIDCRPKRV